MERMIVCALLLMLVSPCVAENLAFEAVGNEDAFGLGVFFEPIERIQIGGEVAYWDRLKEADRPEYTAEIVARYFGLKQAELDLQVFKVPVDWYAGLGLGGMFANDQRPDSIADFRTGFTFGEKPVRLGIEYRYQMPDVFSNGLDKAEHAVFGTITFVLNNKE